MNAIDSLSVRFLDLIPVLAGLLVAVVAGAIGLVVVALLMVRPARPHDPDRPGHRDCPDALEHIRIPGHPTEPVAVPHAAAAGADRRAARRTT